MFDEINEIQIVIVDKQGQTIETKGIADTPDVEERVMKSAIESETSVNTMRLIRPIMPQLNQMSGGMASQLSGQIDLFGRVQRRFEYGGLLAVGGVVLIANEVIKMVNQHLDKERVKATEINTASLLKIRTGEMQMSAGVYNTSTNFYGKVKYGNN